jgi:hypothetical protein
MTTRQVIGFVTICMVVASAWIALSAPAQATTLRRMELPEIVSRSDRIVHARAVDQRVYWDDAGRRIYTDTTFHVIDDVKGQGAERLTVTLLGGRISPVVMTVQGTPQFSVGEEVLLFTSPRPDGKKNLVGFSQGLMRVIADPYGGERVASSESPSEVTYVDVTGKGLAAAQAGQRRIPLGEALELVRQVAQQEATPAQSAIRPLNGGLGDAHGRRP